MKTTTEPTINEMRIAIKRTRSSWTSMKDRCLNPKSGKFSRYGACGITVCERWLVFENFLADMGSRPDGTTVDRYPNNVGNYEPGNCRWATDSEQQLNRTNNRNITIDGVTKSFKQWCIHFGINMGTVYCRERSGMDIVSALSTPVKKDYQKESAMQRWGKQRLTALYKTIKQ